MPFSTTPNKSRQNSPNYKKLLIWAKLPTLTGSNNSSDSVINLLRYCLSNRIRSNPLVCKDISIHATRRGKVKAPVVFTKIKSNQQQMLKRLTLNYHRLTTWVSASAVDEPQWEEIPSSKSDLTR